MPDVMELGFELGQAQQFAKILNDQASAAGKFADNAKKVNDYAKTTADYWEKIARSMNAVQRSGGQGNNFATSSGSGGYFGGGGSRGATGGSSTGGRSGGVSGPYQRRDRLQRESADAIIKGVGADDPLRKDIEAAISSNDKRINKMENGTDKFGAINQLIRSTRFGSGGGLMPLIGRTADALGMGALVTGPVGLALASIVAAGSGLRYFAEQGAAAGNAFAATRQASGGNGRESALLGSLGGAAGFDGGSLSAALQSRITSDPVAMATAAKLGVHTTPGPWGTQDYATATIKLIDAIRKLDSQQERMIALRRLGLDAAEPITRASAGQYAKFKQDAELRDKLGTPSVLIGAADFDASTQRVKDAWDNFALSVKSTSFGTMINNKIADALNDSARGGTSGTPPEDKPDNPNYALRQQLRRFGRWLITTPGAHADALGTGTKALDSHEDALRENTDAQRTNTAAVNRLAASQTPYGGGGRGNNVEPEAYRRNGVDHGAQIRAQMDSHARISWDNL